MSHEEIVSTLKRLLVTELFVEQPEEAIGLDDGLQSVLGLDSIGFLELRLLCERHFQIDVADGDFNATNFSTVGRIADLMVRLRTQAAAATAAS